MSKLLKRWPVRSMANVTVNDLTPIIGVWTERTMPEGRPS